MSPTTHDRQKQMNSNIDSLVEKNMEATYALNANPYQCGMKKQGKSVYHAADTY